MRIEKISDKQIRCTLTQADLQNHHINIGELAYGSEKARSLFQEMLSQASREFNFHAENMPLMIEAVPMSGDNLVLVITKVEDPDEIDTRFSKFSPAIDDDDSLVTLQTLRQPLETPRQMKLLRNLIAYVNNRLSSMMNLLIQPI